MALASKSSDSLGTILIRWTWQYSRWGTSSRSVGRWASSSATVKQKNKNKNGSKWLWQLQVKRQGLLPLIILQGLFSSVQASSFSLSFSLSLSPCGHFRTHCKSKFEPKASTGRRRCLVLWRLGSVRQAATGMAVAGCCAAMCPRPLACHTSTLCSTKLATPHTQLTARMARETHSQPSDRTKKKKKKVEASGESLRPYSSHFLGNAVCEQVGVYGRWRS